MAFKIFISLFWIFVLLFLIITYFFYPEVFWQLFSYSGAGSPFVNTPQQ